MADIKIGWYTDDVSQASIDNLAVYGPQGCTEMLAYNCYTSGIAAVTAYLDAAAIQGITVWVDMRLHVLGPPYPTKVDWQSFITNLMAHSAVKGWYIADEPEYSGPDYATILQYYNWAKEADPVHPVSIAHCWFIRPEFAGPPLPYDALLLDVYPGWGWPSADPDEFNDRVRSSYGYWHEGKLVADSYGVPIEAVPLGFGNHPTTGNPQNGVRDLTGAEHRWHTHTATVLGYAGTLFWWDMLDPSMIQTNAYYLGVDAGGGVIATRFAEVSDMAAEMGNGTTNDPQITISKLPTQLVYRYGADGNRRVILAVNVSRWDVGDNNGETLNDVHFTLPGGVNPASVEVLREGRSLPVVGGVFTDDFTPFQVHAYAFYTSATTSTSTTTTSTSTSTTTTSTSLSTSSSTSLSTTSTSVSTTSTSTTSTSVSTTSTSVSTTSTSVSTTSTSTTSTSVSTTSTSTTSTSVSTTSTSQSTSTSLSISTSTTSSSTSTTSTSTTFTTRMTFWLRGTLSARYGRR